MGVQATVVFTDLHGSTAVFEALGNAAATERVTKITSWIGAQCESHGGRVVKTLGDGVLALFPNGKAAVKAVVELQRDHLKSGYQIGSGPAMPIRVGIASGEVEMVGGDCYGDAVNVASRLCDLCGPSQIWANAPSLKDAEESKGVTFRILGPINVRGRAEAVTVYQIEWREEENTDFLTMQGEVDPSLASSKGDALGREVELRWMGTSTRFKSFELPIHIGRVKGIEFIVNDPRVSRTHARLDWRNGSVMLVDVSSYGSWVRFGGDSSTEVQLRRQECVLHGQGEIALGAPFADPTTPKVEFQVY